MFKFIDKKKICIFLIAVITLFIAFGTTAVNAFAYRPSYGEYRSGSLSEGIYPVDDTPITVKGMKLVFDISDFPQINSDSGINYRSTVTGEYTLYNPTEQTATANLVIAEPERPNYFKDDFDRSPKITVNGEAVAPQIRYSRNRTFSDEWYADSFFSPDLPVHIYKIKANVSYAYLKGDIISDYSKARYIADDSTEFTCNYAADGENVFYILGDDTAADFSALSFYDYNNFNLVKISDKFELEKVESITLKELVLKFNQPADGINDLDWYNGVLAGFSNGECVCTKYDLSENRLRKYYAYSVEIASHGELVTRVTQPVLPDVSSDECYYNFFTASAYSWKGFGKLEIQINTDFYIFNCPENFQKSETGYKAVYPMVPHGTVYFSLKRSYSGNIGNNFTGGSEQEYKIGEVAAGFLVVSFLVRIAIFFVGGGISFVVLMVKKSRSNVR